MRRAKRGADGVVRSASPTGRSLNKGSAQTFRRPDHPGAPASIKLSRHPSSARRGILLVIAMLVSFLAYYLPTHAQDTQRTVWDGVYNDAQAKRGEAVYLEACSNCHGRTLEGADMTPGLTGGAFMANWDGLTVGDLFDRIRISMPADRPGSLSRQEDVDVVAYILRFNQFPSGKEELPREVQILKQILFKASRQ